ncbi:MAG: tetratricopeptide repeat protein [Nitrospinota bacterium]
MSAVSSPVRFGRVVLLAFLALAAIAKDIPGQEGRIQLQIPEVIVVGRGVPIIRVQRPVRSLPGRLSAEQLTVRLPAEETFRPPVPIAFDPGPGFVPSVPRPAKCYENPSSAQRLIDQEGAAAHFRVGYLANLANQIFEAEEQFRAGLDKNPDPLTASYLGFWLGEVYFRQRDQKKAQEVWERVAGDPAGPFSGAASFQLGLMAYRQKDYPQARAWLERFVDWYPGHPPAAAAAFLAGESSLKMGDPTRAVWQYGGALQAVAPRGNDELRRIAKFREGMTLFRLRRFSEASGSLKAFLRLPGVDAAFVRPARAALGWSYYHTRSYPEARKIFFESTRSGALSPGSEAAAEAFLGWLLNALAVDREQEAEQAWKGLKKARPTGRYSLWGALALAGRHFQSGRFERAAQLLDDSVREIEDPRSPKIEKLVARARLLRAFSLYNAGQKYGEAASLFQAISDSGTNLDDTLRMQGAYGLLLARLGAGDPEGAVNVAKSFLKRFPSAPLVREVRFWRGEALLRLKRFADARGELEAVPPGHPRAPVAALGRAYSFYEEGLWLDASTAFAQAAELLVENPGLRAEAGLRQAEARFNARDYKGAEGTFRKVIEEFPKNSAAETAAFRLGEMLYWRADYPAAETAFGEFLRRWPKSERRDEALYWQGLSRIRRGRFALARVSLHRLVRDFSESRFRRAALLQIGHAYYNEGRFEDSAGAYRRVLSENPTPKEAREARYGLVLTRLRSGNTEQFIRDVRSFIRKEPDRELVTALEFQVAEIYLAQKRYRDALASYIRVLRRGGRDADVAHFRIAEIKRLAGKPREAADYYRDLLEKFPKSRMQAQARFRLAESLAASGDCRAALREYGLFIERHREQNRVTQARYGAARCALRLKERDAAEGFFSQVVRSGGAGDLVARSHYELGRIAREKGRFKVSLTHLEAALKSGVNRKLHPRIQFELGGLRQSLKQYPRAVVEYLKVVYLYPKEKALASRALLQVAGIYEIQGKRARALDLYRDVVKDSPQASVRERARARIKALREGSKGKPNKTTGTNR